MTTGRMHHIDLTVADVARSAPFYDAVLAFMGYRRLKTTDDLVLWKLDLPDGHSCEMAVRRAHRDHAHDRYTAGLHHFAWAASSRDEVDRMHALLQKIDAPILDAPADYPQYGTGYYAVFFADPDGLKLEFVYTPPA
jgi:glyoxylase I family protein